MRRTTLILLVGAGLMLGGFGLLKVGAQEAHMAMGPPPKQAVKLQKGIDSYKAQLTKQGKYACCIQPTCDFCATHMGACPCGKMAAMDKPVCRECKGGWEAGEGAISGKNASQIKVMPAMMKGKM
jgi:hypothetical protein